MESTRRYASIGSAIATASLIAAIAAAELVPDPAWAWLLTAAALLAFCAGIGYGISGHFNGLVIDNRNRVSLSKLQASAWSVLVLSAFLAAAIARIKLNLPNPIAVNIPQELLAVMGISATSLVATPVLLSFKSKEAAPPGQAQRTALMLGDDPKNLVATGKVYARNSSDDAQWLDIFRGEEVSNAATPDLGKLQQFLITVVALTIYSIQLWHLFGANPPAQAGTTFMDALPAFSANMAWLIGISHAGYLAYKAAPHDNGTAPAGSSQTSALQDGSVG
jgi:hypothetical protein